MPDCHSYGRGIRLTFLGRLVKAFYYTDDACSNTPIHLLLILGQLKVSAILKIGCPGIRT